jgi:UDP-N-acetylmuramyl pentapeptide phosphotransferase/UDP-N-acetylglucosamine-1-phosphate transferase
LILGVLLALGVTVAVAPVILALLYRAQILDAPSHRSSHSQPTPRGGGLAPAFGAVTGIAASPFVGGDRVVLLGASCLFGALGLAEDIIGIPPLRRFALQLGVGGLAALALFGSVSGPPAWRVAFVSGVAVWLVAFVNAFNFMDGIDGISVAQAVVAGVAWYLVGRSQHDLALAAGGAVLAGATLGFAPFNLPRARMFLGDSGSYFIGAWLAAMAIIGLQNGVPAEAMLAPLAVYAADTGVTLIRRVLRRERWSEPHRQHTYQRLCDLGWSHLRTTAVVGAFIALSSALGAVSLTGHVPLRVLADVGLTPVILFYLVSPSWLARRALPMPSLG